MEYKVVWYQPVVSHLGETGMLTYQVLCIYGVEEGKATGLIPSLGIAWAESNYEKAKKLIEDDCNVLNFFQKDKDYHWNDLIKEVIPNLKDEELKSWNKNAEEFRAELWKVLELDSKASMMLLDVSELPMAC